MRIAGLIWLEDILQKSQRKHGVQQQEVKEVFANRLRFRFIEKGHRTGENVYSALGRTDARRYLIVFFIHKRDARTLDLSCRDMTSSERRRYGKK